MSDYYPDQYISEKLLHCGSVAFFLDDQTDIEQRAVSESLVRASYKTMSVLRREELLPNNTSELNGFSKRMTSGPSKESTPQWLSEVPTGLPITPGGSDRRSTQIEVSRTGDLLIERWSNIEPGSPADSDRQDIGNHKDEPEIEEIGVDENSSTPRQSDAARHSQDVLHRIVQ